MARPSREDMERKAPASEMTAPTPSPEVPDAKGGSMRVRPLRVFEWRGSLTKPDTNGNEIEVTSGEAAELRANGLID